MDTSLVSHPLSFSYSNPPTKSKLSEVFSVLPSQKLRPHPPPPSVKQSVPCSLPHSLSRAGPVLSQHHILHHSPRKFKNHRSIVQSHLRELWANLGYWPLHSYIVDLLKCESFRHVYETCSFKNKQVSYKPRHVNSLTTLQF